MRGPSAILSDEDGAVAIDWVALAAGLLILGIGVVGVVGDDLQGVVDGIEAELAGATTVGTLVENAGSGGSGGSGGESGNGSGTEIAGSLGGQDYFSAACTGSTCYMDTTGDGMADKRHDGNSVEDDGSNLEIASMPASGATPPG